MLWWGCGLCVVFFFFFLNVTATTGIYTLSLHDALPILYSLSSNILSNFERCSGNVSVEVNEMNLDLEFPEASNPWRKVCVLVNGKEVVKPRVQKITRYFLLGKDDFCAK